jgi:2-oxoglutarate dehydrogenase E2 component (dihydrolipoamide succinyltransferase)
MVTEIRVPMTTLAGAKLSVGRWFKRAGNAVSLDEPVVEIFTDSVAHDVGAPATGVLTRIWVPDGTNVEPGTTLGDISQY